MCVFSGAVRDGCEELFSSLSCEAVELQRVSCSDRCRIVEPCRSIRIALGLGAVQCWLRGEPRGASLWTAAIPADPAGYAATTAY